MNAYIEMTNYDTTTTSIDPVILAAWVATAFIASAIIYRIDRHYRLASPIPSIIFMAIMWPVLLVAGALIFAWGTVAGVDLRSRWASSGDDKATPS